jgi:molybdate transport system substrate-binding protein
MKSRLIVAAAALLLFPSVAQNAEIKLLASGAVKDAYLELLPKFEKTSGHKVPTLLSWATVEPNN